MDDKSWILVAVLALVLAVATAAQVFAVYGAEFESPTYLRDRVVSEVVGRVVGGLPAQREWRKAAMLLEPAEGNSVVAGALARKLESTGGWRVLDAEYLEELLAEHARESGAPNGPVSGFDVEKAVAIGRWLGVGMVVFGSATLRDDDQAAECSLKVDAWDTAAVAPLVPTSATAAAAAEGPRVGGHGAVSALEAAASVPRSVFSLSYYRACLDRTSGLYRVFLWTLWLLLLPFAAYPVYRGLFELRSNPANAALLAGFVVAAGAGVLVLNGFHATWTLLVGTLAAAVYDLVVLDRLEEIE
ncbi:MAG: hypothetical protein HYZ53_14955 [Planctomycetes bacterium]|nr:hypothetical protein [Planctomycetota bacterium]